MPSWKKIITSGSAALLSNITASSYTGSFTGSFSGTFTSASYALSSSFALSSSRAVTSSNSLTSSYLNTLNQNVLITGSLTVGSTSLGASENTLVVGPAPGGGAGEGGQILLAASGGVYTSASMIDTYQDQFRVLRGTNAGSDAFKFKVDLHTGQVQMPNYNSGTAFTGAPAANLSVDNSGNILTVQGYTGFFTVPTNPPGQQTLDIQNGIIVNVL